MYAIYDLLQIYEDHMHNLKELQAFHPKELFFKHGNDKISLAINGWREVSMALVYYLTDGWLFNPTKLMFKQFCTSNVSYQNKNNPANHIVTAHITEIQKLQQSFEPIKKTGLYLNRRCPDTWIVAFIVQALQYCKMDPSDVWIKCEMNEEITDNQAQIAELEEEQSKSRRKEEEIDNLRAKLQADELELRKKESDLNELEKTLKKRELELDIREENLKIQEKGLDTRKANIKLLENNSKQRTISETGIIANNEDADFREAEDNNTTNNNNETIDSNNRETENVNIVSENLNKLVESIRLTKKWNAFVFIFLIVNGAQTKKQLKRAFGYRLNKRETRKNEALLHSVIVNIVVSENVILTG